MFLGCTSIDPKKKQKKIRIEFCISEFDQHMEKYREKMESANLAKNFRDNKGSYEKDEKFLAEVDTEVRFLILSFDI